MKNSSRSLASHILTRIEEERAFAEPLLDSLLSRNILSQQKDKNLCTQLVYGTLRMRNRIDWVVRSLYKGDFAAMETGLKNILRVALYQIIFTDRIPSYAAVDEAVKITKEEYPGRDGLANGILRNAIRKMDRIRYPRFGKDPDRHISVYHSHPLWLVRKWMRELGAEETLELCRSNNEIPPLTARVNELKMARFEVIEKLSSEGVETRPTRFSPDGVVVSGLSVPGGEMELFKKEMLQFQDEASQLVSHLVDPRPGDRILDLCAGSGIKTTHMAALMKNRGTILALDIQGKKLSNLKEMSRRMGASIIDCMVGDATEDLGERYHGKFDRVLVDAPCSGLGTVRRKPEIKWHITKKAIDNMAALQKKILNRSARYLTKGGVLVYSTCAIACEENEDVIRDFLETNKEFRCGRPTGISIQDMIGDDNLFRAYPHRDGTDGFFGALLVKEEA
ncbi:MAG: 16S rRNA (cytosine(967)-C(5))-methyltransferase RsmB [Deltaproteobacteria bacterium]|nr:16S rRNA (cytosine(967)-C(5))-methyltransferase RsmB [Deltaproteobacteria bacterium]